MERRHDQEKSGEDIEELEENILNSKNACVETEQLLGMEQMDEAKRHALIYQLQKQRLDYARFHVQKVALLKKIVDGDVHSHCSNHVHNLSRSQHTSSSHTHKSSCVHPPNTTTHKTATYSVRVSRSGSGSSPPPDASPQLEEDPFTAPVAEIVPTSSRYSLPASICDTLNHALSFFTSTKEGRTSPFDHLEDTNTSSKVEEILVLGNGFEGASASSTLEKKERIVDQRKVINQQVHFVHEHIRSYRLETVLNLTGSEAMAEMRAEEMAFGSKAQEFEGKDLKKEVVTRPNRWEDKPVMFQKDVTWGKVSPTRDQLTKLASSRLEGHKEVPGANQREGGGLLETGQMVVSGDLKQKEDTLKKKLDVEFGAVEHLNHRIPDRNQTKSGQLMSELQSWPPNAGAGQMEETHVAVQKSSAAAASTEQRAPENIKIILQQLEKIGDSNEPAPPNPQQLLNQSKIGRMAEGWDKRSGSQPENTSLQEATNSEGRGETQKLAEQFQRGPLQQLTQPQKGSYSYKEEVGKMEEMAEGQQYEVLGKQKESEWVRTKIRKPPEEEKVIEVAQVHQRRPEQSVEILVGARSTQAQQTNPGVEKQSKEDSLHVAKGDPIQKVTELSPQMSQAEMATGFVEKELGSQLEPEEAIARSATTAKISQILDFEVEKSREEPRASSRRVRELPTSEDLSFQTPKDTSLQQEIEIKIVESNISEPELPNNAPLKDLPYPSHLEEGVGEREEWTPTPTETSCQTEKMAEQCKNIEEEDSNLVSMLESVHPQAISPIQQAENPVEGESTKPIDGGSIDKMAEKLEKKQAIEQLVEPNEFREEAAKITPVENPDVQGLHQTLSPKDSFSSEYSDESLLPKELDNLVQSIVQNKGRSGTSRYAPPVDKEEGQKVARADDLGFEELKKSQELVHKPLSAIQVFHCNQRAEHEKRVVKKRSGDTKGKVKNAVKGLEGLEGSEEISKSSQTAKGTGKKSEECSTEEQGKIKKMAGMFDEIVDNRQYEVLARQRELRRLPIEISEPELTREWSKFEEPDEMLETETDTSHPSVVSPEVTASLVTSPQMDTSVQQDTSELEEKETLPEMPQFPEGLSEQISSEDTAGTQNQEDTNRLEVMTTLGELQHQSTPDSTPIQVVEEKGETQLPDPSKEVPSPPKRVSQIGRIKQMAEQLETQPIQQVESSVPKELQEKGKIRQMADNIEQIAGRQQSEVLVRQKELKKLPLQISKPEKCQEMSGAESSQPENMLEMETEAGTTSSQLDTSENQKSTLQQLESNALKQEISIFHTKHPVERFGLDRAVETEKKARDLANDNPSAIKQQLYTTTQTAETGRIKKMAEKLEAQPEHTPEDLPIKSIEEGGKIRKMAERFEEISDSQQYEVLARQRELRRLPIEIFKPKYHKEEAASMVVEKDHIKEILLEGSDKKVVEAQSVRRQESYGLGRQQQEVPSRVELPKEESVLAAQKIAQEISNSSQEKIKVWPQAQEHRNSDPNEEEQPAQQPSQPIPEFRLPTWHPDPQTIPEETTQEEQGIKLVASFEPDLFSKIGTWKVAEWYEEDKEEQSPTITDFEKDPLGVSPNRKKQTKIEHTVRPVFGRLLSSINELEGEEGDEWYLFKQTSNPTVLILHWLEPEPEMEECELDKTEWTNKMSNLYTEKEDIVTGKSAMDQGVDQPKRNTASPPVSSCCPDKPSSSSSQSTIIEYTEEKRTESLEDLHGKEEQLEGLNEEVLDERMEHRQQQKFYHSIAKIDCEQQVTETQQPTPEMLHTAIQTVPPIQPQGLAELSSQNVHTRPNQVPRKSADQAPTVSNPQHPSLEQVPTTSYTSNQPPEQPIQARTYEQRLSGSHDIVAGQLNYEETSIQPLLYPNQEKNMEDDNEADPVSQNVIITLSSQMPLHPALVDVRSSLVETPESSHLYENRSNQGIQVKTANSPQHFVRVVEETTEIEEYVKEERIAPEPIGYASVAKPASVQYSTSQMQTVDHGNPKEKNASSTRVRHSAERQPPKDIISLQHETSQPIQQDANIIHWRRDVGVQVTLFPYSQTSNQKPEASHPYTNSSIQTDEVAIEEHQPFKRPVACPLTAEYGSTGVQASPYYSESQAQTLGYVTGVDELHLLLHQHEVMETSKMDCPIWIASENQPQLQDSCIQTSPSLTTKNVSQQPSKGQTNISESELDRVRHTIEVIRNIIKSPMYEETGMGFEKEKEILGFRTLEPVLEVQERSSQSIDMEFSSEHNSLGSQAGARVLKIQEKEMEKGVEHHDDPRPAGKRVEGGVDSDFKALEAVFDSELSSENESVRSEPSSQASEMQHKESKNVLKVAEHHWNPLLGTSKGNNQVLEGGKQVPDYREVIEAELRMARERPQEVSVISKVEDRETDEELLEKEDLDWQMPQIAEISFYPNEVPSQQLEIQNTETEDYPPEPLMRIDEELEECDVNIEENQPRFDTANQVHPHGQQQQQEVTETPENDCREDQLRIIKHSLDAVGRRFGSPKSGDLGESEVVEEEDLVSQHEAELLAHTPLTGRFQHISSVQLGNPQADPTPVKVLQQQEPESPTNDNERVIKDVKEAKKLLGSVQKRVHVSVQDKSNSKLNVQTDFSKGILARMLTLPQYRPVSPVVLAHLEHMPLMSPMSLHFHMFEQYLLQDDWPIPYFLVPKEHELLGHTKWPLMQRFIPEWLEAAAEVLRRSVRGERMEVIDTALKQALEEIRKEKELASLNRKFSKATEQVLLSPATSPPAFQSYQSTEPIPRFNQYLEHKDEHMWKEGTQQWRHFDYDPVKTEQFVHHLETEQFVHHLDTEEEDDDEPEELMFSSEEEEEMYGRQLWSPRPGLEAEENANIDAFKYIIIRQEQPAVTTPAMLIQQYNEDTKAGDETNLPEVVFSPSFLQQRPIKNCSKDQEALDNPLKKLRLRPVRSLTTKQETETSTAARELAEVLDRRLQRLQQLELEPTTRLLADESKPKPKSKPKEAFSRRLSPFGARKNFREKEEVQLKVSDDELSEQGGGERDLLEHSIGPQQKDVDVQRLDGASETGATKTVDFSQRTNPSKLGGVKAPQVFVQPALLEASKSALKPVQKSSPKERRKRAPFSQLQGAGEQVSDSDPDLEDNPYVRRASKLFKRLDKEFLKSKELDLAPRYTVRFARPPTLSIVGSRQHIRAMPELFDGLQQTNGYQNGSAYMNGSQEGDHSKKWDPTALLTNKLYKIDYNPLVEKRNRYRTMEGHLEVPNEEKNLVPEIEKDWKKLYFRVKDGRFQWFANHCADEHPIEDVLLTGTTITPNKEDWTLEVKGGKENANITVRTPSNLFEKWHQALLSHSNSKLIDAYVQPVYPPVPHYTQKVVLIELGTCSIRAGVLTNKPSLPQTFFPATGCVTDAGEVFVGIDAFKPEIRCQGRLESPIQAADHQNLVERYKLNKLVLEACLRKVLADLRVDPAHYKVLLSIPQNIPTVFICDLLKTLLQELRFKAASIARQPSLILYSYDVTTGVVVDIGDRLNIVPVIDEYIVENAIISLPFGAQQIRDSLKKKLSERNNGIVSFNSAVEQIFLRHITEQSCYVATDYEEESKKAGSSLEVEVNLDKFNIGPGMENKFTVDSARFHATEGLFKPKRWNLEMKGIHQLIHDAIQQSPIDSRRSLYRNIYLTGGTSLLAGLAERLETELCKVAPTSIFVQVHGSPWRYHSSYLGSQVIANSLQFSNCCADLNNLDDYIKQLELATN